MSPHQARRTGVWLSLFLIACSATAVAAVRVALKRMAASRQPEPAPVLVPLVVAPPVPISAEAQVFRTTPSMLAIEPGARRERSAHPRRLKTVRFLRAYPGAPPRIPHPLRADELRNDACRTCHERGGWSARFQAYVPLTPHPERGICLQCHVGVDGVLGLETPNAPPDARCSLCHGPAGGPVHADASLTWPTTVWPKLPRMIPDQDPPAIPHDLQYRQNCLTCHSGPAAVEETRTKHPERLVCRQCHLVPDPDATPFSRVGLEREAAARGAP